MKKIFLYGTPGSGKTTIGQKIADDLDLDFFELDDIRTLAQKGKNAEDSPFLFYYTTMAWQKFGELNRETAIKGFLAVRKEMSDRALKFIKNKNMSLIAESAFLDPAKFSLLGNCFLVACKDELVHHDCFFVHRKRSDAVEKQFVAARYIDEFLIDEVRKLNIEIFDNSSQKIEDLKNLIK